MVQGGCLFVGGLEPALAPVVLGHFGIQPQTHSIREPVRLHSQPSFNLACTKIYELTLVDAHLGQELLFLLDAGTALDADRARAAAREQWGFDIAVKPVMAYDPDGNGYAPMIQITIPRHAFDRVNNMIGLAHALIVDGSSARVKRWAGCRDSLTEFGELPPRDEAHRKIFDAAIQSRRSRTQGGFALVSRHRPLWADDTPLDQTGRDVQTGHRLLTRLEGGWHREGASCYGVRHESWGTDIQARTWPLHDDPEPGDTRGPVLLELNDILPG